MKYGVNTKGVKEIEEHLYRMSNSYTPPLHTYVDIEAYAAKLADKAVNIEFIDEDGTLRGMISSYYNPVEKVSFCTNFSLEKRSEGIGHKFLTEMILFHKWLKYNLDDYKKGVSEDLMKVLERDFIPALNDKFGGPYMPDVIRVEVKKQNERLADFYQRMGVILEEVNEEAFELKVVV